MNDPDAVLRQLTTCFWHKSLYGTVKSGTSRAAPLKVKDADTKRGLKFETLALTESFISSSCGGIIIGMWLGSLRSSLTPRFMSVSLCALKTDGKHGEDIS